MTPHEQVIDLHTHSSMSDGTQTPTELVAAAVAAGIDVLAITDHDTVGGWAEAERAARAAGLTLVKGVEISCHYDYSSVHLLGYLIDPADSALATELGRARESRATRLERMVERMTSDGIPISYEQVLAQVRPGATPGRPHIADALIEAGVIQHRDEAFADWLSERSPYYVGHYAVDLARAVRIVRAAGGVPVIAHPFTRTRCAGIPDSFIEQLAAAGLGGLEAYHRDHGPAEVARAERLAAEYDLLLTGSSDYHGDGKRNRLAENTTRREVLDAIIEQSSGATPVVRP
ncbi:MAG: PHP domain-containing protein [Intrasporangium sp.]|uniref:PHP domain-containing protein n=1 Tax=Intrasporangium sp. TaxID=1925024 RepID=UPI0026488FFF|nr:PHP domain-containing protein [Intrasporangium sp.]MDN5795101.1 PHP domain-containing protein [Intrasporangium sp.]